MACTDFKAEGPQGQVVPIVVLRPRYFAVWAPSSADFFTPLRASSEHLQVKELWIFAGYCWPTQSTTEQETRRWMRPWQLWTWRERARSSAWRSGYSNTGSPQSAQLWKPHPIQAFATL